MTIGFCAAFPSLGTSYVMIERLHFSAYEVATAMMLCSVPWCVKPLWAYVSDAFPVCGYRRRPYVCVFSLVASAFIARLRSTDPGDERGVRRHAGGASFALCFVDVAVDGSVMVLVGAGRARRGQSPNPQLDGAHHGHLSGRRVGGTPTNRRLQALMTGLAALPLTLSVVSLDIPDALTTKKTSAARRHSPRQVLRTVLAALWRMRYGLGAATVVALVPRSTPRSSTC